MSFLQEGSGPHLRKASHTSPAFRNEHLSVLRPCWALIPYAPLGSLAPASLLGWSLSTLQVWAEGILTGILSYRRGLFLVQDV